MDKCAIDWKCKLRKNKKKTRRFFQSPLASNTNMLPIRGIVKKISMVLNSTKLHTDSIAKISINPASEIRCSYLLQTSTHMHAQDTCYAYQRQPWFEDNELRRYVNFSKSYDPRLAYYFEIRLAKEQINLLIHFLLKNR